MRLWVDVYHLPMYQQVENFATIHIRTCFVALSLWRSKLLGDWEQSWSPPTGPHHLCWAMPSVVFFFWDQIHILDLETLWNNPIASHFGVNPHHLSHSQWIPSSFGPMLTIQQVNKTFMFIYFHLFSSLKSLDSSSPALVLYFAGPVIAAGTAPKKGDPISYVRGLCGQAETRNKLRLLRQKAHQAQNSGLQLGLFCCETWWRWGMMGWWSTRYQYSYKIGWMEWWSIVVICC